MNIKISIEKDCINMTIEKLNVKGITENERKQLLVIHWIIDGILTQHEKEKAHDEEAEQ